MRRLHGKQGWLAILWLLATYGCATEPGPSPYRVEMPILSSRPTEFQVGGNWYRCYAREDAVALVIELKAACLALSGTPAQCQTEATP